MCESHSPQGGRCPAGQRGATSSSVSDAMTTFTPSTSDEVLSAVQWALAEETPLEIIGHGSKRKIGRPQQTEHVLDLSGLAGVTLYEPEELVLSSRAGTPLSAIEELLARHGQQLAFEPMAYGPLPGAPPSRGP